MNNLKFQRQFEDQLSEQLHKRIDGPCFMSHEMIDVMFDLIHSEFRWQLLYQFRDQLEDASYE